MPIETAQAEVIQVIVGLGLDGAAVGGNGFIGSVGFIVCAGEPPPASGLFVSRSVARVKARRAGSYAPCLSWNAPETSNTGTESALMAMALATFGAAISSHLGPSCLSNFRIWASASPA